MKLRWSSLRCTAVVLAAVCAQAAAQEGTRTAGLPVQYEELSAPQIVKAVELSGGVCVIPLGIIEKHGPHLPLETDLLAAREVAVRAAGVEYCVVFPPYYVGQIFEAKHQPGALAYSADLIWKFLQETCDELGRNGFTKIILENWHGGNNNFLAYFCQAQLASRKPYAVVLFRSVDDTLVERQARAFRRTDGGGHAGEDETSIVYALRPDLLHPEAAATESGADMQRLADLPPMFTGIWWYAKFPNHYSGDGSHASRELGELLINADRDRLVKLIRSVKENDMLLKLQERFYNESERPLDTKQ